MTTAVESSMQVRELLLYENSRRDVEYRTMIVEVGTNTVKDTQIWNIEELEHRGRGARKPRVTLPFEHHR